MPDIYKGKIIHVKTCKIKFPDGHTSLYECVYHKPAVMIIPLVNNDKIMLIHQYRPVINKKIWELPAGLIEKGESPRQTAQRELEEETGLKTQNLINLGTYYSSPGFTDELTTFFLAKNCIKSRQKLDPDEKILTKPFPMKYLFKQIKQNKIQDIKTVTGILMALSYTFQPFSAHIII